VQGFTWTEILLAVPMGIAAFLVNLLWIEMVDLLNQRRPEVEKLSYYSSTPWSIAKLYLEAYPKSKRPHAVIACMAISLACFVAVMVRAIVR
jgi:hypothetical protein